VRDLAPDHALAAELAGGAGELLVALRAELTEAGADPSTLKAEGDARSHEWLMDQLAVRAPGDAVLSEEGSDDDRRLGAPAVWIVDPLDGTREFSEVGRSDWAVHVALCIDGTCPVGAVALPAAGRTLATPSPPAPTWAEGAELRLVVSRTRPPAAAVALAERLGGELVAMGSAGAKAMAVVLGDADIYVHTGGQYEWDSAAPAAVAAAAGLHVSRVDGRPLRYNNPDPYLPDLLICRPDLAAAVLEALAEVLEDDPPVAERR